MIELTEEPYDGPVATALVEQLLADLNERYAEWAEPQHRPELQQAVDDDYLAEVTPAQVCRPTGAFLVAWIDGAPVGCGGLRAAELAGVAEVKRMYTSLLARRRGVGRTVLVRLEEIAAELGYAGIRLATGTPQPEAIALYESNGWQRTENFGAFADHPASVCFGKVLAP